MKNLLSNYCLTGDCLSLIHLLLRVHCLASCDGNHLVDVVYRATAAEVVHWLCDTLEDRTDSVCISKSLNELIGDVTYLKAWEYEYVCMTGDL